MKITMKAVAVTGLTSGALLLAPAGMAFADSSGSGAPGAPGVSIPTSPKLPQLRTSRVSIPTSPKLRQLRTSVADSSSVSNNRLGPWLGLIGNSLNGSLNNSLNGATVSALNDGARVSALNGLLSPPFTVLSGNTIVVRITTIDSDNSSTVTQSETTTITTNGGAPGQQG